MTYTLPHQLDRPGQLEAMDWILNSDKKYLILCAPTGFGKSPLAAAASIDFRTLALVLHKSLQSANYKEQYNFDVLYGKGNYPCSEKNKKLQYSFLGQPKFTAYDCSNPNCDCPYQRQELHCLSGQRTSLNYAKFLMSKSFAERFEPEYLFLDEAHNLPSVVTDFVGLSLDWNNEFLQCNGGIKPKLEARLNYNEAMVLFRQCARAVQMNKPEQSKDLKLWRKWKRLHQKIAITDKILASGSLEDWYYETTDKSLIIKPLTAKYHFKRLFDVADKAVLMSATIKPSIAERLGLEDDEWDYYQVPNIWPVPSRLIYDLGGPSINYKSSEEDRQRQAELIASVLSPDKSGVIHVSSKSQAYELATRLSNFDNDYYDFYYSEPGWGTDKQIECWYDERQPGTYCISWNFHEGVDLGEDEINIVAKIPYVSLGSNYEKAKLEYDPQWYKEQAAMKFEQALGRNRRGKPEHYGRGSRQVYIADSAWHSLKTLLSDNIRKTIRKWNGY
jgi:Rad3-related DNA helicase